MRSLWAIAIALAIAAPVQGQEAQATATDAFGDVDTRPVPLLPLNFIDIRQAMVAFTETQLEFTITVESLTVRDPSPATAPEYWLEFTSGPETFHFSLLLRYGLDTPVAPAATLYRGSGTTWKQVSEGEFGADFAANTVSGVLPLTGIVAESGEQLAPGNRVHLTEIHSFYSTEFGSWHDRATHSESPVAEDKALFPDGTELVVPGVPPGDIELRTTNPIRYSNGEATTFHWAVAATNHLPAAVDAHVQVEAPEQLQAVTPGSISIPATGNSTFDVYVTVPFQHRHGEEETIEVSLVAGASVSRILLGIHYPAIPQPAGHHPTVWLHGAAGNSAASEESSFLWVNTLEDDEDATATRLTPNEAVCTDSTGTRSGLLWAFPLEPALRIGLDARLEQFAHFEAAMAADLPVQDVELLAKLAKLNNADNVAGGGLFEFPIDADVAKQSYPSLADRNTVSLDLPIPRTLDLVEPGIENNLALLVAICKAPAGLPSETAPGWSAALGAKPPLWLEPGARLTLPLNEYHDPIETRESSITLSSEEVRAAAAPGANVRFDVSVELLKDGEYNVGLLGLDEALATTSTQTLSDLGTHAISVTLRVPSDAQAGESLEVIAFVQRRTDPTDAAALRLIVDVDPTSMRNDAAGAEQAPQLMPILLVLLVAFLRRRNLGE